MRKYKKTFRNGKAFGLLNAKPAPGLLLGGLAEVIVLLPLL